MTPRTMWTYLRLCDWYPPEGISYGVIWCPERGLLIVLATELDESTIEITPRWRCGNLLAWLDRHAARMLAADEARGRRPDDVAAAALLKPYPGVSRN